MAKATSRTGRSRRTQGGWSRAAALVLAFAAPLGLGGCSGSGAPWHATDVTGSIPDLRFNLVRAQDGRTVSAADYRGKVTLLYFGYTYCPDVCPMTLSNLAQALKKAGADTAGKVRVLFITVDPDRDTLPALKTYAAAFGPEFEGLRGSPDELATLAKRYRIAYSVTPDANPSKYQVSHSSALYVFDKAGKARLLMTSLSTTDPDIPGTAADLKRLAATG